MQNGNTLDLLPYLGEVYEHLKAGILAAGFEYLDYGDGGIAVDDTGAEFWSHEIWREGRATPLVLTVRLEAVAA